MSERDAFLRAIAADVYDDTARLAFADYLDEHGEHARAEFVRVQVELEPMRDRYEIPRAAELHRRENELRALKPWQDFTALGVPSGSWGHGCRFARGFPDLHTALAAEFIMSGAEVRLAAPTLRRVVLRRLNTWGERVAACEALRGLPELELGCWYADDDLRALAASPHLAGLQVLVLWTGRQDDTDATLVRLAASGKAWPNLRELVLFDPAGENERAVRELAAAADRTAGRKLARYERGYPDLFPLAPDIGYCGYPGRLPDGRLAVAEIGRHHRPGEEPFCGWEVWTFDPDGTPRRECLRVPLPAELMENDWSIALRSEEQALTVLRAEVGFVPAFIRVKYWDEWDAGPRPGHYQKWKWCGVPDDPNADLEPEPEQQPYDIGETIQHLIDNVEFVVGYDAWADKRGQVHST